jgi:hypothetical protein
MAAVEGAPMGNREGDRSMLLGGGGNTGFYCGGVFFPTQGTRQTLQGEYSWPLVLLWLGALFSSTV